MVDLPRRNLRTVSEGEALVKDAKDRHLMLKRNGEARADIRTAECTVFGAEGALALARARENGMLDRLIADYQPLEIQAIRVGDMCLVGLPGECFVAYGLAIKGRAALRTVVASLVNGEQLAPLLDIAPEQRDFLFRQDGHIGQADDRELLQPLE